MASDQLERADLFLPEKRWGELDLTSSTNPWLLLLVGAGIAAACTLMAVGGGGPLTWWAAGGFIALLGVYTALALSGVARQNEEVESLLAARTGEESG